MLYAVNTSHHGDHSYGNMVLPDDVSVVLLVTMVVAAFVVHGADPFGKKELALLYGAGALTLMLTGAGRLSIDALVARRREHPPAN